MGMLANRLRKNFRHLRKWANRNQIECFRVYDHDIPEWGLSVDYLAGSVCLRSGHGDHESSLKAVDEVCQGLDLTPGDCFGLELERPARELVVGEGGHRFWLRLGQYRDYGLFLDHRSSRALVGEQALGQRLLNLFCYTGSFTVYAAAARQSLSLDLSANYLEWARRNFDLNGLGPQHRLERADVLEWLADEPSQQFDIIVCDPPTFSNSKKMSASHFDIQTHHRFLIERCVERLAPGGWLLFSTNFRKFRLDPELAQRLQPEELSPASIPEDFRDRRVHRCWRFHQA